jgi:uncharacterized membrane protein
MNTKHARKLLGAGAVILAGLLLVGCGGDFKLPTTTLTTSVPQGRSSQPLKVTFTRDKFEGEVSFSITGAPTGVTAKFDPVKTDKAGTETTLTLTVGEAVAAQKYTLKVVAQSGNKKKEQTLELTVQVKPDFTMATNPATLTVKQGAGQTVTINLTRNASATGAIALTLEGAPAGVTGTFNPASATAATSTLTINAGATAAAGTYNLTVRGKGDGLDKTAAIRLTVEAVPDFSFTFQPAAVEVKRGESANVTVALNRVGGFADPVQFEVEGLPTGVTATFDPNPAPAATATLKITSGATAAAGTYPIRVRGTAGATSKVVSINLTIP